nr:MAG TPA: hypothetical protein [Caudoviricetes sp.]
MSRGRAARAAACPLRTGRGPGRDVRGTSDKRRRRARAVGGGGPRVRGSAQAGAGAACVGVRGRARRRRPRTSDGREGRGHEDGHAARPRRRAATAREHGREDGGHDRAALKPRATLGGSPQGPPPRAATWGPAREEQNKRTRKNEKTDFRPISDDFAYNRGE